MNKCLIYFVYMLCLVGLVNAAITDNNRVYYSMDNGSISAPTIDNIEGTSAYDATMVGTPTVGVAGILIDAVNFDGDDDYVDTKYALDTYSISFWFKSDLTDCSDWDTFAGQVDSTTEQAGDFIFDVDDSDQIRYTVYHGNGGANAVAQTATGDICDQAWHHVVATTDGIDQKLYVDGVLKVNTTHSQVMGNNSCFLYLARIQVYTTGFRFDGDIDEVSTYSVALTDDSCSVSATCGGEIADLYNSGAGYNPYASADTCTCAGSNTNWEIDLTDSCVLSAACNLGTGNLTFINTGTFTLNATLNTNTFEGLAVDQTVYMTSIAYLNLTG